MSLAPDPETRVDEQRLLVIEHDSDTPAGLLADWADGRGLRIITVALHAGQPLPGDRRGYDAAVVLGSEHTAYDDRLPWLAAELTFVEGLVGAGVPVLGICFGGQVLARVLGARLYRLDTAEFGWIQVASQSPALAPGPWLSWHRDAFELPSRAVELAANAVSVQAFATGPHLGVQFHPEATRPILADWAANLGMPPDPQVAESLFGPDSGATWQRAAQNASALFSAWLDGDLAVVPSAARRGDALADR